MVNFTKLASSFSSRSQNSTRQCGESLERGRSVFQTILSLDHYIVKEKNTSK
jgi:hypothetical protein